MPLYENMTPAQAADFLARRDPDFVLLDVRQPEEVALARVDGALLVPMSELQRRLAEVDRTKRVAVLCHHGSRSQFVATFLVRSGYPRVANVVGGIDAWARDVDASVGAY